MTMAERMIPPLADRDTGGFFAAAAEGRLVLRTCSDCGRVLNPQMAHCRFCGSWNTGWKDSAGRGTLYSWTVVTHGVHPAYPTPYTVVLVDVDDAPGARLVGMIPGEPSLRAGQPMEVWFDPAGDGAVIPQWRPVDAASS